MAARRAPARAAAKLLALALILGHVPVYADEAGSVHRVIGRATITSPQGEIRPVRADSVINSADIISTGARSYVRARMADESLIMVRPNSRFEIIEVSYDEDNEAESRGLFALLKGGFRAISGLISDKRRYRYNTSVATIGIRGTEFGVRMCNGDCFDIDPVPPDGLFIEVMHQDIVVSTGAGDFPFSQGQFVYIAGSNAVPRLLDGVPDIFDQSPIPPADPGEDCE